MVSDSTQEHSRVMVTTWNSAWVYSPVVDLASAMGRNAAAVVSDEVSSGARSSFAERTAASTAATPSAICTMIDSDMTMALSTSSPRAMISAASDIWLIPMPNSAMKMKLVMIAIGIRLATTRPVRTPRVSSITSRTIATAWTRLPTKSLTFLLTASAWKTTVSNSTPIGYSPRTRSMVSRTAAPRSRMLPPSRSEMASARPGSPLARIVARGGST